jgi:serine/threonine protein kinase
VLAAGVEMNNVAPVLPGETLAGKYRVERVIGQGGMGVVVAARHLELDERVAIKFLVGAPSDSAAERFLREARAAAKVKGEHVCRVFDFGRLDTGEPYIVMEYLEGTDLARVVMRGGPQRPASVVGWIVEVCAALAEAHAMGIVHRDLKPANVFLAKRPDESSCAKVLDFGISKLPQSVTMTGPTAAMGSPLYMSPEQMESARDVDARADVWSLGVVMYELLTGKPPFVGESMAQLTVLVREKEPPPMEGVQADLAAVVMKCLAKRPADRYVGVAELATALAPFAPDDVAPLLSRLMKRTTPALDVTEPAAPHAKREPEHVTRARGTFEPLQSTMGEAPPPRRWPLAVGAIAAIAIAVIAAKSIGAHPVTEAMPEAAASSSTPVVVSASASPTETLAPVVSAPVVSASTTSTLRPAPRPTASATPAPTASATVTASPPATAAPPATATSKRRELDREDPL